MKEDYLQLISKGFSKIDGVDATNKSESIGFKWGMSSPVVFYREGNTATVPP